MYTAHLGYCSFAPSRGTTVLKICASIAETRMHGPASLSHFALGFPTNQYLKPETGKKKSVSSNQIEPGMPTTSTGFQVETRLEPRAHMDGPSVVQVQSCMGHRLFRSQDYPEHEVGGKNIIDRCC